MSTEPGMRFFDSQAQANAAVEQMRAETLEVLRTATSYSVAAVTENDRMFCSTAAGEGHALEFLAYAAAKSFRSLAMLAGPAKARQIFDAVLEVVEDGWGE